MKLPKELEDKTEWLIVGPLGPHVPEKFSLLPHIAVDGGAHFTDSIKVWIGDSDSYDKALSSASIFNLSADKDSSDFACALKLFSRQIKYEFHLWGFSGGRKDHELFVWGEVLLFLDQHPESKFTMYDPDGRVECHFLGSGHWRFKHQGLFSLGSMRKIRVKLSGSVKYPIARESWLPSLSSWGLSNVGSGEIILENEGAAFIYYPGEE